MQNPNRTSAEYVDLPIYRDELASALGFTTADLEANRSGRLTELQRATQFRTIAVSVALSIVSSAVGLGLVVLAIASGSTTWSGFRLLLLAAVFLAFTGMGIRFSFPLWKDLSSRKVLSLEGVVQPAERETLVGNYYGRAAAIWSYYWVVDKVQRFQVSGKAYGALTPARHRLYYLALTRRVVAAEPVGSKSGTAPT